MAAKGKAFALVAAAIALFVTPAAVASIPRITILDPQPIDRSELDDRQDGHIEVASIDNVRLLHRALARALPASAPVASLSETRVWGSTVDVRLAHQVERPLSRALRKASAASWAEIASDRTVLTPDPASYGDSSTLYSYCAGDPVNCSDPTGNFGIRDVADFWSAWRGLGSSSKEIGKTLVRTGKSVGGAVVGAANALGQTAAAPITTAGTEVIENVTRVQMAVSAYQQHGMQGVLDFNRSEGEVIAARSGEQLLDALPLIGTARSFGRAWHEYENENYFGGGMAMGETIIRAEGDAALVYGGVSGVRSWRAARAAAATPAAQPVPRLTGLKFGENDLVYGPSSRGYLRALRDEAGGVLLEDMPKPAGMGWTEFSYQTMDEAAATGRLIRFDLTRVTDLQNILRNRGPWAGAVTSHELRYLQANWSRFSGIVRFYRNGIEVPAPWR